jgi:S-adenosylmethionine synthetase
VIYSDVEIVERKGLGHPDTICDEIAEKLSLALSRRYLAECGEVLHHNVDKALLVGGAVRVKYGGGQILKPIELFLAGRAATSVNEKELEMDEIARDVVRKWFTRNIPTIDLQRHLVVHSLVRPGSAELGELYQSSLMVTDCCPISCCDGHDSPWPIGELIPGISGRHPLRQTTQTR